MIINIFNKQGGRLRKKSKFFVALHPSFLQSTLSTNHHSGFARLEFGSFFFAV